MKYRSGLTTSLLTLIVVLSSACTSGSFRSSDRSAAVWRLNSLTSVNGNATEIIGNPTLKQEAGEGKAVVFDGKDDGLLVEANPIAGAEEFSIEVVFKPFAAYPENIEQRFLHIQDPDNPNRRILMELRLNDRQQWYADFFMRTDNSSLTLIDSTKTHPVNEWATMKLVYKDKQLKGYVNGVEELSGEIEYMPIARQAKTSIGTRMDKRSWFNGAIKSISFRHQVED